MIDYTKPVKTLCGHPVRVFCTNYVSSRDSKKPARYRRPILAAYQTEKGEHLVRYYIDGKHPDPEYFNLDLTN